VKTTVDIADSLLEEAKAYAASRHVPLKQVIEEGLRAVTERKSTSKPFKLRDASVGGRGLQRKMSWDEIRGMIYHGRGE